MTGPESQRRARARRAARLLLDSLNAPTELTLLYRLDCAAGVGRLARRFALRTMRRWTRRFALMEGLAL